MGADTEIAWAHSTFNPWWGCVRVDELCRNCYAETWDRRWGGNHWGPTASRRFFPDAHWREPLKWNREAEEGGFRRRVFCASMADVFEDRSDLDEHRLRLWHLIIDTPSLDWLLLTKRPENIHRLYPKAFLEEPPENVWLGTSVGDRKSLARLEHLRHIPAAIRWVSGEPQLEDLGTIDLTGVSWWVAGGESGSGARPFDIQWPRDIRDQCKAAGVAFFFKQAGSHVTWSGFSPAGGWWPKGTRTDDTGRGHFLVRLKSKKGSELDEVPKDLRIREFPRVA